MTDCTQHSADRRVLFDGGSPWDGNWQSDIARDNKSLAYIDLTHHTHLEETELHGWLDRKNINDRPFASIATNGAGKHWDLLEYDAIEFVLGKSDGKVYTIALYDHNGIPWEAKFRHENNKGLTTSVTKVIRFSSFTPRHEDADPAVLLEMGNIRKIELAFPSMNGKQEGSFMISIHSINVVRLTCECAATPDPKLDRPLKGRKYAWEKVKYRTTALAFKLKLKKPGPRLQRRRRFFWRSRRQP